MRSLREQSPAFRQALLKSERLRILILLALLGVSLLVRILRTAVFWNRENATALLWLGLSTLFLAFYELLVLRAIRSAAKTGQELVHPVWLLNIFVECCIPGLILMFLGGATTPSEYRAIISPAFSLYFVLIILSTLRISPRVSGLCGLVSATGYLWAAYYQGWRLTDTLNSESLFAPPKIVVTNALALLVAGAAAGFVALEIRKQVEAALREAETRREMEHLQHDLEVARSIQQSLLPKAMPDISGFDIAAWNKPADQTGGDYYDWQVLPDGRVVVALADVTGHGIGPALLAAVCRAYSRAIFGQHKDFLESMSRINSAIGPDVGEGRFVTFVATILGANTPEIELLSAGHAPLFVYWLKHDRFDLMEAQGLPLGISQEFLSDPPQILPMEKGDLLVLATDGFFEWANRAEELFGTARLENSVRANRHKQAGEIISSLYQDVLRFGAGTPQKDDLTAIVIKRI